MCFETTKTTRAKIAKTDIECWKALRFYNGHLFSACENYLYIRDIAQPRVEIKKEIGIYDTTIWQGYHSCRTEAEANDWKRGASSALRVKMFIIPKGTRYYQNETEYVSETIMLVG